MLRLLKTLDWSLFGLSLFAAGCTPGASNIGGAGAASSETSSVDANGNASGAGAVGGSMPRAASGAAGSAARATAGTPANMPAAASGVPCDVANVVSNNCTGCHASPTQFGAPMPLMSAADFQAPAKSDMSRRVYQVIPARIGATDITRRMPPSTSNALSSTDLKLLNDWVSAGAVASMNSCPIVAKPLTPTGGSTGPGSSANQDPSGAVRSGGASDKPIVYDDPQMTCHQFRAHAQGDKTKPFSVSTTPDMYTNFTFMPPWQGTVYARSFKVLTGNGQVIHHWLFYKNSAAGVDGDIAGSSGVHPDGELVHGWAPGGSDLYLDPDVGLEMPGNVSYTLETHHNNTTGTSAPDDSGIDVCVTPMPPKNVASLSWLGTDAISGTTASGTCTPTSNQPVHIIGAQPHMHLKGRHMSVIIKRKDGSNETLHDAPFDFNNQHSYDTTTVIMPGDSLTTTCTYSEPAQFGETTNDEMCYFFTLYYPKLSLTNGNIVSSLIHGPNTCL